MYPYIPLAGGRAGGRTNCCRTHTHTLGIYGFKIFPYGSISRGREFALIFVFFF